MDLALTEEQLSVREAFAELFQGPVAAPVDGSLASHYRSAVAGR